MNFVQLNRVNLVTEGSLLRLSPKEYSFIAGFGLAFFHKITKDPNTSESQASLSLLYQYYEGISALISTCGQSQYLEYFNYLYTNLNSFSSLVELVKTVGNEYLIHTIYYVFSALYALILKVPLFQSHPSEIDLFSECIQYFCTQLGVELKIYSDLERFTKFGIGLSIDLFFKNSEFAVLISIESEVKDKSQSLITEIFNHVSIPSSLKKFEDLIEVIKEYQAQYKTLTPAMENLLTIRKNWTCNHDLKTIKFSCGLKHCYFCVFDNIKFSSPEESVCKCGYLLTPDECEKVFKKVQPEFRRFFKCFKCKKSFQLFSSLACPEHKVCLNCRSVNRKNCVVCLRRYSEDEVLKFPENDLTKEKNPDQVVKEVQNKVYGLENKGKKEKSGKDQKFVCRVCTREFEGGLRGCKNFCEICRGCWRNFKKCEGCKEDTDVFLRIFCAFCKKEVGSKEMVVLECRHPYHRYCCKKDKCRMETI